MDRHGWDARYAGEQLVWSAEPNRFLVAEVDGLTPGRALDVACGEGRNAIWLAEQGWTVTGVDFSTVAIDKGRRLAGARAVSVHWELADVTEYTPPLEQFDLVIVMYLHLPDTLRRLVFERAAGAVAPGGTLLVVGHDITNPERGWGGPQDHGVLYGPEDVAAGLDGLDIVKAQRVERPVATAEGDKIAIDALVRATRRRVPTGEPPRSRPIGRRRAGSAVRRRLAPALPQPRRRRLHERAARCRLASRTTSSLGTPACIAAPATSPAPPRTPTSMPAPPSSGSQGAPSTGTDVAIICRNTTEAINHLAYRLRLSPTTSSSRPSSSITPTCSPGRVLPVDASSSARPTAPSPPTTSPPLSTAHPVPSCWPSREHPMSPAGCPPSMRSPRPPTSAASRSLSTPPSSHPTAPSIRSRLRRLERAQDVRPLRRRRPCRPSPRLRRRRPVPRRWRGRRPRRPRRSRVDRPTRARRSRLAQCRRRRRPPRCHRRARPHRLAADRRPRRATRPPSPIGPRRHPRRHRPRPRTRHTDACPSQPSPSKACTMPLSPPD